jgi:hypothetical protein
LNDDIKLIYSANSELRRYRRGVKLIAFLNKNFKSRYNYYALDQRQINLISVV